MPSEINPLIDRNNHLSTLCEHYGKSKNDALEGDLNQVKALINPTELLIIFVAIIVTLAIPWISFFHFFFFFFFFFQFLYSVCNLLSGLKEEVWKKFLLRILAALFTPTFLTRQVS